MSAVPIQKVSYTHDAMIDLIIGNPRLSQGELARHFGYSQPWISTIMSSDAFKARLAERRGEIVDPALVASMSERLEGLALQSLEVLKTQLELNPKSDVALKTLEITTRSLGYGVKQPQAVEINNYVVALPEKARSGKDWEAEHARVAEA